MIESAQEIEADLQRAAVLPAFPFATAAALDLVSIPVWVHDRERASNVYANAAGLRFWGCDSIEELAERSHADMSQTSRARVDALFARIGRGERLVDRWTFYPLGEPVTVDGTISGVWLGEGKLGLLFEAAPSAVDPIDRRAAEALRYASVLATLYDDDGRVLFRNPAAAGAYPGDDHRFIDRFSSLVEGVAMWKRLQLGMPVNAIVGVRTGEGLRWHGLDARSVTDPVTGKPCVLVNERDVTALKSAEASVGERERRLSEAQQIARLGDWRLDVATGETTLSAQLAAMFGFGRTTITGEQLRTLLSDGDPRFSAALDRVMAHGGGAEAVSRLELASGRHRHVWTRFAARRDEAGRIAEVVGVARDITEEVRARERIDYLAMHDSVTRLANRVRFGEALIEAMLRGKEAGGCLAVMDLDGFKEINDRYGHEAGDAVLVEIGRRLSAAARPGELVARLGGDEFGLIFGPGDAEAVRQRVDAVLERGVLPVAVEGALVTVGASIGLAVWPEHGDSPETLQQNADLALYSAKLAGGGKSVVYAPGMRAARDARRWVSTELPDALLSGAIEVHYQPIVALSDGRLAGFEALVRWRHAMRGLVLPDDFVELAEVAGLGAPLGSHVLRQALEQLRHWLDAGLDPGRLAVNLGAGHLAEGRARTDVIEALDRLAIPPQRLELEVTESVTLRPRAGGVVGTITALHDLGVSIVLDDFGTGQASLTHLNRLPVDRVKIDRSFVAEITRDRREAAIVRAIAALARELGMSVVAEGVETAEQAALLRAAGCEFAQGFLYGRPMPGAQAAEWMRERAGAA
jgi:diguanylate cyclase (GGDEF)-like protein/PAS domain S-box-containing protein